MRHLDIDWTVLLDFAPKWDDLTPRQRGLIVDTELREASDAHRYGLDLDGLVNAGMLERFHEGARVRVTEAFRPALKVLRFLARAPIFEGGEPDLLAEYLLEAFTIQERAALAEHESWNADLALVVRASSTSHLTGFLECEDVVRWERDRLPVPLGRGRAIRDEAVLKEASAAQDLRELLRTLMEHSGPIAFTELPAALARMSRRRLAGAIGAGLRYLLCFVGFDEGMRPMLGLLPAVRERLARAPCAAPERVDPEVSICTTWGIDDVVQLLVFCSEPRRLRAADRQLFAKAQGELAALLAPLPAWLSGEDLRELRVDRARETAQEQELVRIARDRSGSFALELADRGRSWLALAPAERARRFLEPLRVCAVDVPLELFDEEDHEGSPLAAAFASLEGPVFLDDFLRFQSETANPLLQREREPSRAYGTLPMTEEMLEERWADQLLRFIQLALVPFGGARPGMRGERSTFELTDVGRYLLGLTETLAWPEPEEQVAILVQPDFEIVFLAPNPALEASITRFAERIGQGVGALFRLTRSSVQSAVRAGLTSSEILATLREVGKAALPDNVEHEIEGWCSSSIQLAWQPAQLLRCPDEETAARVLSAARGKLEALSPTVLALADEKQCNAIANACRKQGVFLDPLVKARARKPKQRRRRWGW